LNSLWGKFGQRKNLSNTEWVTDPNRFYEILLNEKLTDINFKVVSDEMLEVSYRFKDVFVQDSFNTNEYIAAFTTSNARLRLYDVLDVLGDAVIYYDTDSIVYIDNSENTIKTGSLLGDLTLEDMFDESGSTGPKSYSYQDVFIDELTNLIDKNESEDEIKETKKLLEDYEIVSINCQTKVKGFTLNFENSQIINHDSMVNLVKNYFKQLPSVYTLVDENKITRNTKNKMIENKYQEKIFKFDYDKRVIYYINDDHIDTYPYGY
jgi:hypothetical protein